MHTYWPVVLRKYGEPWDKLTTEALASLADALALAHTHWVKGEVKAAGVRRVGCAFVLEVEAGGPTVKRAEAIFDDASESGL